MIKFGIRQSFDRIDQIEDRYMDVGVPVEVALPYYLGHMNFEKNGQGWERNEICNWLIIG